MNSNNAPVKLGGSLPYVQAETLVGTEVAWSADIIRVIYKLCWIVNNHVSHEVGKWEVLVGHLCGEGALLEIISDKQELLPIRSCFHRKQW